ncbi:hypothetical protein K504DRAFT_414687 [Pleomassaria siparia CBS 279.74]|uniref:Large ribosomal subunit protein uL29m n=1 Tax=Pleomassaria siparia CBS 279.74 TaxID=1314801 RepID=A0A6G1JYQ3_9PLEO|nr:hypothetical protein K504DRAFT_414687 [Pleomassaria siparia CBS 279.74]
MTAIPTSRMLRPQLPTTQPELTLFFLAPSLQHARTAPRRSPIARFSTSPALWKRDNNKNRGLSVLRHTGLRPRQTLSVKSEKNFKLPKPVVVEQVIQGDENHGLWGFFPDDRRLLMTPSEESRHGKPWTAVDLEQDMERMGHGPDYLHSLWWTCVKERNRLATEKLERERRHAGYGDHENEKRDEAVQGTMKAILEVVEKMESEPATSEEQYLDQYAPYSDIPESEEPQLIEAPEERKMDQAYEGREDKQEGSRQDKELPEPTFFNATDNPPTLEEKLKQKADKILWNK